MPYRLPPLTHFSKDLRGRLEGKSPKMQKIILEKFLIEKRKQLAREGTRRYSRPILGGQTDARTIVQIQKRWRSREIATRIKEGKKPADVNDVRVESFDFPLRRLKQKGAITTEGNPSAVTIAKRFVTREILTPLIRKNYSPEIIRIVEQIITHRGKHILGLRTPLTPPTLVLIIKLINATKSDKRSLQLLAYLTRKMKQIKIEAIKSSKKHKSDAFINVASSVGALYYLIKFRIDQKESLLRDAKEIVAQRHKALQELKSAPQHKDYAQSIHYIEKEIKDYNEQIVTFAKNNGLNIENT